MCTGHNDTSFHLMQVNGKASATQDVPGAKTEREDSMKKLSVLGVTALTAALITAAPVSLNWSPAKAPSLSLDAPQARIGHPLTPGSVAGVHRRVPPLHPAGTCQQDHPRPLAVRVS
jgi:hypothetical protein